MKRSNYNLLSLAMTLVLLALVTPLDLLAQEQQKVYAEIACVKAKNEGLMPFVMDKGKKFNQELQKQGLILDWIALQVMYPNGEDCECDMRMVTIFDSMAKLDKLWDPELGPKTAQKVFGDKAMDVWEEFQSLATDKGSAVYEFQMAAADQPQNSPMSSVRWLNVPGKNMMEFQKMEKEVWMPVVKKAMKKGIIKDYHIWTRVMPGGSDMMGNVVTVADFDSFAHMGETDWDAFAKLFNEVHPDEDMMEMAMKSQSLSDGYTEETLKVLTSLTNE